MFYLLWCCLRCFLCPHTSQSITVGNKKPPPHHHLSLSQAYTNRKGQQLNSNTHTDTHTSAVFVLFVQSYRAEIGQLSGLSQDLGWTPEPGGCYHDLWPLTHAHTEISWLLQFRWFSRAWTCVCWWLMCSGRRAEEEREGRSDESDVFSLASQTNTHIYVKRLLAAS